MSFQPFAPWSTPRLPASARPTPIGTKPSSLPLTPATAPVWSPGGDENVGAKTGGPAEERPWKGTFPPLDFGEREERNVVSQLPRSPLFLPPSSSQSLQRDQADGQLSSINTNGIVGPSLGLASPFVPPDAASVWGPPYPPALRAPIRQPTVEEVRHRFHHLGTAHGSGLRKRRERSAISLRKMTSFVGKRSVRGRMDIASRACPELQSPIRGLPGLSPAISKQSPTFYDPLTPRGFPDFIIPRGRSDDESCTRVSGSPPDFVSFISF